MTAIEDPAAQPGEETAGPDRPSDDLEDWLSDLRTQGSAGHEGWMRGDHPEEPAARPEVRPTARPEVRPTARPEVHPTARSEVRPPARPEVRPAAERDTGGSAPGGGGRHRAAD
jgi:hypothetical protein